MRFIQKWSYWCAKKLAIAMNENHQKKSVYYYGFQIVIGAAVKGVLLITIASLLGILIPTLLITVAFASLRMIAGGYHMDTYGKCILVSLGLFIVSGLIAEYTNSYWNSVHVIILITAAFILGLYVLLRYAPKDTPNKPITNPKEIKKFKTLSIVYLFVWLGITLALVVFSFKIFAMSICFGMLLELFAISPTGHKFFDLIKDGFKKKKTKIQIS
jgi:accessory gene regulator B